MTDSKIIAQASAPSLAPSSVNCHNTPEAP